MSLLAPPASAAGNEYPDSDGKPMADNTKTNGQAAGAEPQVPAAAGHAGGACRAGAAGGRGYRLPQVLFLLRFVEELLK